MPKLYRTLLVIDETPENGDAYEEQLQQDATFCYQIIKQQDDRQILALCRSQQIDGILLELYHPRSSSLNFIGQLRQQMGEHCPPILVIASNDAELAVQAFKNGVTDYLIKERMTPNDLRLAMRSAIANTELRQKLQRDLTQQKQAEVVLKASQERYQDLAEAIPQMVWIADATGKVNYWNQRWYEYTGLSEADSMGLAGVSTVHPDDRDRTLAHWSQSLANKEPFEIEYRIRRWNGVYHWFISRAIPTRESQGQITGWVGTITNIDNQKQLEARLLNEIANHQRTEQDLRAANQQITSIFESMTDAFAALDREWRFTYVNQAAIDIISYLANLKPKEILGKSHWEIFPSLVGKPIEQEYRRAMAQQVTVHLELLYEQTGNWFEVHVYPSQEGLGIYFRDISDRKHTEVLLRENQAQLQHQLAEIEAIYQSAPIGLSVLDTDLRFVRINERLAQINGLSVEAHIGRTVRELLPDLADTAEQILHPILETGQPLLNVEIHGETPAQPGVKRTWLEHFLPLKNGERVIGISIVCEEITERLQAEAALRESEERFRNMANNAPVMVWVTDVNRYCTFLSQSWYEFTGQTEGTGLGFGWLEAVHPDDREFSRDMFLSAYERQEGFRLEYRLRHKDGTYRWAIDAASPWFTDDGKFKGYIGSVIDISDRKQSEEALRCSEERYRTLFNSIDEGFCIIEMLFDENDTPVDYRFLEINPIFEQQTGLQQAVGKTARQLVPNLEADWIRIYGNVALTGEPARFENASQAMNRWFDVYACCIGEPDAHKVALVFKDISDRKLAEQEREKLLTQEQLARAEAESANRIKDEFLTILSHELRSPLNPILGWTKLLQTRKLDDTKIAEALATIERNAKLQIQLIDDLLDIAKILRGKLSLNFAPVNLSSIIAAAIETVRTATLAKSISLNCVLPDILQMCGDAARLQQVIWNLLSNAIKFTPTGGQVEIRMEQIGNQAQITVRDTGKGINPDFLPHIFETFRQEDASTTRKYGGLGLGLAIVRQLVEAHGGTIKADSPGEGLGSTFTVWLPLLNVESQIKQTDELPIQELDLTGIRVLTVDDDPDARELLTVLLSQYGAEVISVASAAEVLAMLASFQPDVLVSDIGMPHVDGYSLIQQIRALPPEQGGNIPAIALTAYARVEDYQQALNSGYQQHITKPFEPEQLVQAVATFVKGTRISA